MNYSQFFFPVSPWSRCLLQMVTTFEGSPSFFTRATVLQLRFAVVVVCVAVVVVVVIVVVVVVVNCWRSGAGSWYVSEFRIVVLS